MRASFKRILAIALLFNLVLVLGYVATRIWFFVHIFMPHTGTRITQDEVAIAHNATTPDPRPQVIPKIIHQVFHNWKDPGNETLPADWEAVRQTCIDLNEDWEYKLWTERLSRNFIELHYNWFLKTYDGLTLPVQKVDVVRYFLILHYGGIYLDLDNGCTANLEPLLYYPAFVTDGGHGALSNNILGAAPNHPFWQKLTATIVSYAYTYPLPYFTVSYGTGQWFETAMWEEYHARLAPGEPPLTRVMMDMRPGADPWVFFTQERGGTWSQWDNSLMRFVGDNILWIGLCAAAAPAAAYWAVRRRLRRRRGYRRVGKVEPGGGFEEVELR